MKRIYSAIFLIFLLQCIGDITSIQSTQSEFNEGLDYSTQVLNNPWDMKDFQDIHLHPKKMQDISNIIQNENGLSFDIAGEDPFFTLLYPGYFADTIPLPDAYLRGVDHPHRHLHI